MISCISCNQDKRRAPLTWCVRPETHKVVSSAEAKRIAETHRAAMVVYGE